MMKNSLYRLTTAAAVIAVATLMMVATSFAAYQRYKAELWGTDEVPPVATKARGAAHFRLSKDGLALAFKLEVANLENITAAHIHLAPKGSNGDVVALLFSSPTPRDKKSGTLVKGILKASDLTGPMAGKTLSDLVKEIEAGNAYVNVHTTQNPQGEIRGQIRPR